MAEPWQEPEPTYTLELSRSQVLAITAAVKDVVQCSIAAAMPTAGNIAVKEQMHAAAHRTLGRTDAQALLDKLDAALRAVFPEITDEQVAATAKDLQRFKAVAEAQARNRNRGPAPEIN